MSAATNLTVAVIATLATKLHEGRQALEAGRPADAVAALTAVVEQSVDVRELGWAARWYRAQAHRAANQTAAALEDLQWLATRAVSPDLRAAAREAYLAAGGEARHLAPRARPIEEWRRVQSWIAAGQPLRVFDALTEKFADQVRTVMDVTGEHGPEALGEWLAEENAVLIEQRTDEAAGIAELVFRQDEMLCTVTWRQVGAEWKIAGLKIRAAEGESSMPALAAPTPEPTTVVPQEVAALVEQLAAQDPTVRAKARATLRDLGADAHPALRSFRSHPDPEVAETIRELLGEK